MATINIVDNNGNIIPNLRADIMRQAMQPKCLLVHKGGIYAGTGVTVNKTADGNTYPIYTTTEIYPQTGYTNGAPLISDSSQTGGLKFGSIPGSQIINHSINVNKLTTTETVANKILVTRGGTSAPSFEVFTNTFIPNHIITAEKLAYNICDSNAKTSADGAISIKLGQDSSTHKIQVKEISLDLSILANYLDLDTIIDHIRNFTIDYSQNILYIS